MPRRPAVLLAGLLALLATLCAACSMGSTLPDPRSTLPGGVAGPPLVAEGTCWSAKRAGADPQQALDLARAFGMSYFDAAYALADRPAFTTKVSCAGKHAVEVYKVVPAATATPTVADYSALLRINDAGFAGIDSAITHACLDESLAAAAARTGLAGAALQPALPDGFTLGWAPAPLALWNAGQQVYACTLTQRVPSPVLYGSTFTGALPVSLRTCATTAPAAYVDCGRVHDRERIAVLDLTYPVSVGTFPGRTALRRGRGGRYLDVGAPLYAALDRACTTYLRSISSVRRLTGVAEIDPAAWPTATGAYRASCEADAAPGAAPVPTRESVYDR